MQPTTLSESRTQKLPATALKSILRHRSYKLAAFPLLTLLPMLSMEQCCSLWPRVAGPGPRAPAHAPAPANKRVISKQPPSSRSLILAFRIQGPPTVGQMPLEALMLDSCAEALRALQPESLAFPLADARLPPVRGGHDIQVVKKLQLLLSSSFMFLAAYCTGQAHPYAEAAFIDLAPFLLCPGSAPSLQALKANVPPGRGLKCIISLMGNFCGGNFAAAITATATPKLQSGAVLAGLARTCTGKPSERCLDGKVPAECQPSIRPGAGAFVFFGHLHGAKRAALQRARAQVLLRIGREDATSTALAMLQDQMNQLEAGSVDSYAAEEKEKQLVELRLPTNALHMTFYSDYSEAMLSRCLNLWLESVFQSYYAKRAEPIAVRHPLLAQYMSLTKAPDSTLPESSTRVHYLPGLWPELFLDMSGAMRRALRPLRVGVICVRQVPLQPFRGFATTPRSVDFPGLTPAAPELMMETMTTPAPEAEELHSEGVTAQHLQSSGDLIAKETPGDSISCLAWSPSQDIVAAGCWDRSIYLWEVLQGGGEVVGRAAFSREAPVLSCAFSRDGTHIVTGGCDHKVMVRDVQSQKDIELGSHAAPVRYVSTLADENLVVSGSWDKTLRFWSPQQPQPVNTVQLPDRVFAMDVKPPLIVVALADRQMLTFDLSQGASSLRTPSTSMYSALKMQTRAVCCFPSRAGYAAGGIEGRCSVKNLQDASKTFSFKCHQCPTSAGSVNGLDFHPVNTTTLVTAGSDGSFIFWETAQKKCLKRCDASKMSISACRFNASGSLLAYAVSYDWSKGCEGFHDQLPRLFDWAASASSEFGFLPRLKEREVARPCAGCPRAMATFVVSQGSVQGLTETGLRVPRGSCARGPCQLIPQVAVTRNRPACHSQLHRLVGLSLFATGFSRQIWRKARKAARVPRRETATWPSGEGCEVDVSEELLEKAASQVQQKSVALILNRNAKGVTRKVEHKLKAIYPGDDTGTSNSTTA
ncbi:Poly(A)+ RNA export protein [Symbiodinium microadriaticum]|uniref:Poly(A)+ RNA export protein n=1 Tax=Symbiodinium microadriaticum TaxID=2951 RepID=A0A1Q9DBF1_SYMMI|nr:Poly(A)+ RNA export protein [Symbiodinium microadriaticum]